MRTQDVKCWSPLDGQRDDLTRRNALGVNLASKLKTALSFNQRATV